MPDPILAVAPLATEVPVGTDLGAVVADVDATGVSAPAEIEPGLVDAVGRADHQGIELSIIVVPKDPPHDSELRDLATAVGTEQGGTVLVLSPGQVGTFSDSISRVVLEAGQDRTYTGNPVVSADNFVDEISGSQTPWGLVTGAGIVVVVAVVGLVAAVKVRRRRRAETTTV